MSDDRSRLLSLLRDDYHAAQARVDAVIAEGDAMHQRHEAERRQHASTLGALVEARNSAARALREAREEAP